MPHILLAADDGPAEAQPDKETRAKQEGQSFVLISSILSSIVSRSYSDD